MSRAWILASLVVCAVVSSVGCATTKAAGPVDGPPLAIPPPPTRVVAPPEPDTSSAVASPAADEPAKPAERRRTYRPRGETPAKTEPKKPNPPPVVVETPAPPAALQTAPAASQGEIGRRIRDTIALAEQNLGRVRTGTLDRGALEQYNTARRFLRQAREALKDKNLVYAQTLADKAATIASDLSRRVP